MKCQFEDCMIDASHTWALLPLYAAHHELIKTETSRFYYDGGGVEQVARPNYYKIDLRIACSKRNLKLKRGEKI